MPRRKGESHYKHGKITEILSLEEIQERINKVSKQLTRENLAYFWLLYWAGCRKSEGYERTLEDIQLTKDSLIIDFHQRKKHGAQVPPLKFPRDFPGIEIIIAQYTARLNKKASRKLLERSDKTGRHSAYFRSRWLFPHINRTQAGNIVKKILGENYYPHFLRLNRITELGTDPGSNFTRLKSFSGIKTMKAMEAYLGTSEKEQDAAIDFMAKQIRREQQKEQ